jgi:hypothetical protein
MANTQTSVPLFVANQVLTAAQQNTSAGTGVPVFATTVTRDAAFGGSNKALAEGQLCYLESTNVVQYYDGAAWATVGPAAAAASGLTFISATTIGTTVSSVTVSGAFSSTYDNYLINVSGGVGTNDTDLGLRLGSTSTGYYDSINRISWAGTSSISNDSNGVLWFQAGRVSGNYLSMNLNLFSPNLADQTTFASTLIQASTGGFGGASFGFLNDTTQYTAFTLIPSAGTITGGTIRVYGYQNS